MKLILALVLIAAPAKASEIDDASKSSLGAFYSGRFEEAVSGYRYLDTLTVDNAEPSANLGIIARDRGRPDEAVPLWLKATLLAPNNAFYWNQRGWAYVATEHYTEAKESFKKAIEVSSTSVWTAEAYYGLGFAENLDSGPKKAVAFFQQAFPRSPYLLPAAAVQLARLGGRVRQMTPAEVFFKQALDQDPLQPDIAREMGQFYEKAGMAKAAWLAYKIATDLDPTDAFSTERFKKLIDYIREKPERLLPARRLARPLLQKPEPPPESDPLRVALFSNALGKAGFVKKVYFIVGSKFKIIDSKLGEVNRGEGIEQWEMVWRAETNVVELRDVHQQLQYATKQPFRIEPVDRGSTVLLKMPEMHDVQGVDVGDRELRGSIDVYPTPFGVQIVNELGIEEYLYGQVAVAIEESSIRARESLAKEALKAQAVASRSRLSSMKNHHPEDPLRMHVCDSGHCQIYAGITQERSNATQAVKATIGGKLYLGEQVAEIRSHPYCSGRTEDGIFDKPGKEEIASALDLELMTHGYPGQDLYCEAANPPYQSTARWVRVIESKTLHQRLLDSDKLIGKLLNVSVVRRSPTGRVQALLIEGSKSTMTIEGAKEIGNFLYPGGLRSTLFTIQPLYKHSSELRSLLIWGAGTGDGRGICQAGALGLSVLGKSYREILAHYYPGAIVKGLKPSAIAIEKEEAAKAAAEAAALRVKPITTPAPGAAGAPPKGSSAEAKQIIRKRSAGAKAIRERLRKRAEKRRALQQGRDEAGEDEGEDVEAAAPAVKEPVR